MQPLPIDSHKEAFYRLLDTHEGILLSAPPGTGKSTRIPIMGRYWLQHSSDKIDSNGTSRMGSIVVLQPRRLAAISLSHRVASEMSSPIGKKVGFEVRGSKKVSEDTEIVFHTYGHFFQKIKSSPTLSHVSILILDEFHERQVEMDLIWAWIQYLKKRGLAVPKIILMSATLDQESIQQVTQSWGTLQVTTHTFPIETTYVPPKPSEKLEAHVIRSIQFWLISESSGTCICFLPGWGEIQKIKTRLVEDILGHHSPILVEVLHGSLKLEEQQAVCRDTQETRIILTTNLAETSLTIPNVTGVIDSGYEREASWKPDKGVNVLEVQRITLQSAKQRQGRAGRTGPGWCLRLWDSKWESDWENYWRSGLLKQEWALSLLGLLQLLHTMGESSPATLLQGPHFPWLTPPEPTILKKGLDTLTHSGATDSQGCPLPGGEWMARLPIHPKYAQILYQLRETDFYTWSSAMIALLETSSNQKETSGNLLEQGKALMNSTSRYSKETVDTYQKICASEKKGAPNTTPTNPINSWEAVWSKALEDNLGVLTSSNRYQLISGFVGDIHVASRKPNSGHKEKSSTQIDLPPAILALDIWESHKKGPQQGKTGDIRYWIPLSETFWKHFVLENSTSHFVCKWLAKGKKVSVLKESAYRGVITDTQQASEGTYPKEIIRNYIVEQIQQGEHGDLSHPLENEEFTPYYYRYQTLCKAYPEYGFPDIEPEDIELLLHEWVGYKKSLKELTISSFQKVFQEYIGPEACGMIEHKLPMSITLPSGKKGKFQYHADTPPELSARITDFTGMEGAYFLCDGKVEVVYNLLAPNFRSMQKTKDLTVFWKSSYPEIKKELKGRYPKHPWP
jgi:ATP-dependent helicase HrpB